MIYAVIQTAHYELTTTLLSLLFWGSFAFIIWTYVGYPLAIWLLSRRKADTVLQEGLHRPSLTVVMAVRNGAALLTQKLDDLCAMEYPAEQLEIIVVDDGSEDETWQLAREYAAWSELTSHNPPKIRCLSQPTSKGKPAALNLGVAEASGEIILFCDVRQRIAPCAASALVAQFSNPEVGAASGALVMASEQGPGMYWRYERAIREAEARFDSTVGATGALYAIRRHLFQTIPEESLIDDVYVPLCISLQGYRVIFVPEAEAYDQESQVHREFQRKARTLAGNFQLLEHLPALLSPKQNRLFLQFMSHKLMRLLCPYALLLLLLSSAILALNPGPMRPWYAFVWVGQLCCYASALLAGYIQPPGYKGSFLRLCRTFVVLNASAVVALFRFLRRDFSWTR